MVGLGVRQGPLLPSLSLLLLLLPPQLAEDTCDTSVCCSQDPLHWGSMPGLAPGPGGGPSDLDCYRIFSTGYECSWRFLGPATSAQHFLRICMESRRCCSFPAGGACSLQFSDQDGVSVLQPVTVWVDTRGPGLALRSAPRNLTLNSWVRYDPPAAVALGGLGGQLLASWEVPARQEHAEVQVRHRLPGGSWELGDCRPGEDPGPRPQHTESCSLVAGPRREMQFRRRRLGPGGPWSEWSRAVCSPPETPPTPRLNISLLPLGPDGRRRLSLSVQAPPASPEGCREALPAYSAVLRMRSCCGPWVASRTLVPGKTLQLRLSGAAYDLTVAAGDGTGPNLTWPIPDEDPAGAWLGNSSVGAPVETHYCAEWRLWAQSGDPVRCTVARAGRWNPAAGANLSRMLEAWAPDQEACYNVSLLASVRPRKLMAWSSVLFTHYYGGNVSAPQLHSVRNISSNSAWVHWAPSPLGGCPGVLTGYTLRYWGEDSQAAEQLVVPTETHVTLRGLREGTTYTVQVRADKAWRPGPWSQPQRFSTRAQFPMASIFLASLGSFLGVLLLGALGYLGLSRAARHLCPPLPSPWASSAVQLPSEQWKQAWLWVSPVDFPEEEEPQADLVVDMPWDQEAGAGTRHLGAQRDQAGPPETGVLGSPAWEGAEAASSQVPRGSASS